MSWTQAQIDELKEIQPSVRTATYQTSDGIVVDVYVDYMILHKEGNPEFFTIFNSKYITYSEFKRMANMKAFW